MPDVVLATTPLTKSSTDGDLLVVGPSLGTTVTDLWSDCATLLSQSFELIGWDLPGHGRSAPTDAFSVRDLADAVIGVTENARRDGRRCWYAGVSLGGAVGLELALRGHRPFEAIAVLASAAKVGQPAAWRERESLVREAGTAAMVEPSSQRWFAPGFLERQPDVVARLLSCLADTDRESYAAACDALAEYDLRPFLTHAAVPLLLMPGSDDQVVSAAQAGETADNAPGAKVHVLDGCGHLPPAEHPAAVAAVLLDFFAHHPLKATGHDH